VRGNPQIIEALNLILTSELTGINQYFIHAKMCKNWGYDALAKHNRDESIEEMKHAERVIERILFLDGVPNLQRLDPIRVGENVPEQFQADLEMELAAVKRYNEAIALCSSVGDHGTRELLEHILTDEEESVDWHETQLALIKELGKESYLAEKMSGS